MKLLLDTHVFIWWFNEPEKLSKKVLAACEDNDNELILSVASVWEMQIKSQLGKLTLTLPLAEIIETQHEANHIDLLPIHLPHVLALEQLPTPHKDPFDRLLIAQAKTEGAILLSCDPIFASYPVNVLW